MTMLDTQFVVLSPAGSSHAIVAAAGDIDVCTSASLATTLTAALHDRPKTLTLDVSDVAFIDTAGLTVLRQASARASQIGTSFRLWQPGPGVLRLLHITGLDRVVPVLPDARTG